MKVLKYAFVGGTAAVVDFVIFAVGVAWFPLAWFPVAVLSFVVATVVNYLLSITFVFERGARFSSRHEWLAVLAVSAGGLIWNQAILWALIETVGVPALTAKVSATGCVFFWNYSMRRYFVFAKTRYPAC